MIDKERSINKFRQIWTEVRWMVLGVIWLTSLIMGYAGFARYAQDHALDWTLSDMLYRTLQLVILESGSLSQRVNPILDIARFLLPALTIFTVLQALMLIFQEQLQWLRLWRLRDHIIVCGVGRKGGYLSAKLLEQGYKLVMIDNYASQEKMSELRQRGGIILHADATDRDVLLRARIQRASHVICLLGDDYHNLQIALQSYHLTRASRSKHMTCVVHLISAGLLEMLKNSEFCTHPDESFKLQVFNPYERTARWLIAQGADDYSDDPPGKKADHIVIIGLGRLGKSIAVQAAYNWHLHKSRTKLQITVIDQDAEQKSAAMLQQYPRMADDCQIQPQALDIEASEHFHRALQTAAAEAPIKRLYICLGDALLSLQVCLEILRNPTFKTIPVYVRIDAESGLIGLLDKPLGIDASASNVKLFDLIEQSCSVELLLGGTLELLAHSLHEHYLTEGSSKKAVRSGRQHWQQLSDDQKEENRRQAQRIQHLLAEEGYRVSPLFDWDAADRQFDEGELLRMARREHEHWRQAKQAQGWRFGNVRDDDRRIHPDLVDWDQLPQREKDKNLYFVRHLPQLLAQIGFQLDKVINN